MPSALMTTARTGLSPARRRSRARSRRRRLRRVALTAGTKSATTARRRGRPATAAGRLVGGFGRRAEHVDRIRETRLARQQRRDRPNGLLAELGQLEPSRLAGVGAQDPEPAGVRQHGDAAASRHRLRREQSGDVDELLERLRPDDARLVEERIDRCFRAGERCGCELAARAPAPVVPLLTARIGFVRATRRASAPNRRGLPNDSR